MPTPIAGRWCSATAPWAGSRPQLLPAGRRDRVRPRVIGRLNPGRLGYEQTFRDLIVSAARRSTGLRRVLLRSVDEPDEGISLSVWHSLAQLCQYRDDTRYEGPEQRWLGRKERQQ